MRAGADGSVRVFLNGIPTAGCASIRRKRGELNGTPGDNESVHHYADQYVNRVCRAGWFERNDSFDPSC